MPTYQYACNDCDHAFEQVQSFTDDSLTTCPRCEGRLRKIFNAVGVVFKGSGFYRTDSRADAKKASSGGSTPAKTAEPVAASTGATSTGPTSTSQGSPAAATPAPARSEAGAA